jgi:hypothetical protein
MGQVSGRVREDVKRGKSLDERDKDGCPKKAL